MHLDLFADGSFEERMIGPKWAYHSEKLQAWLTAMSTLQTLLSASGGWQARQGRLGILLGFKNLQLQVVFVVSR